MKNSILKNAATSLGILLSLLLVDRLPSFLEQFPRYRSMLANSAALRAVEKMPAELHNGNLNPEDFDALAGGYYEGLRNDNGAVGLPGEKDDVRTRHDFLRYEFRPSLHHPYAGGVRETNSLAMPNPEYGFEKPPHTRRIALLGDSVSVGPYGHSYETLLEQRLNQQYSNADIRQFQILNFAVYGYSIVQTMDVAFEKVPQFHPDVYLLEISVLELMGRAGWTTHVGDLMVSNIDLKYDYLRKVVAQSGAKASDHLPRIRKELTPYLFPVYRWALEQIRDQARAQGAQMMIIIVPPVLDPQMIEKQISQIQPVLENLGVPVVDLGNTFEPYVDLDPFQVIPKADIHPNVRGNELIFENLFNKLQKQPQALSILAGQPADSLKPR